MATDVHCHLDLPAFDADRGDVIARAVAAGVDRIIVPSSDPADWGRVLALAAREPACEAILGVHPWYAADLTDDELARHLDVLATADVIGIGEIGMDHVRERDPGRRERQRDVFRRHLLLAIERDLPVEIHAVHAVPAVLAVVDEVGLPRAGGMFHLWSSSPELARQAVKRGFYLSFGAMVGEGRAKKAIASAAVLPLERMLLETDAPRPGTRGEPADLVGIAASVAAVRGCDAAEVWETCARNADDLFPRCAAASNRAC